MARSRFIAVIPALLASLLAVANAQMSREEITVRAAYAKLAYAQRLGVILRQATLAKVGQDNLFNDSSKLKSELDDQLAFQFQAINVGNLADIADRRWDSLVTKPQLDLISASLASYREPILIGKSLPDTEMTYVIATWQRWNDQDQDWNIPVSKVMTDLPKDTLRPDIVYSRYASYTVTAKLLGRQRTYQAIFLFGKNPDGTEAVFPIDHVVGMGTLNEMIQRSIYPEPLVETYMRELPGVKRWIASATITSASTVRDVLCDAVTGSCGLPSKALEKSLAVPIDPGTRRFYEGFPSRSPGLNQVSRKTTASRHHPEQVAPVPMLLSPVHKPHLGRPITQALHLATIT